MDPTESFTEYVNRPEAEIRHDTAALLIAAHAHPDLDVREQLLRLDALAESITEPSLDGLRVALFGPGGFAGNTADYGDPANSFLDDVLDRRLGIPISLSVLMIAIGERINVETRGVSLPGHFLVGVSDGPGGADRFCDPFNGGRILDVDGAMRLFQGLHPGERFDESFLDAVGPRTILFRMLANLARSYAERDPQQARWVLRLQLVFPDIPEDRRRALAGALGDLGAFDEAAAHLEDVDPDAARTFRSRLN